MSDLLGLACHKSALAEGREQGRAVRRYLEAPEATRPRRGPRRSPEPIKHRLEAIEVELQSADPLHRLHLVQERSDPRESLETLQAAVDLQPVEESFVAAASPYSARKGISYRSWREVGVPADVLARAGITRNPGKDHAWAVIAFEEPAERDRFVAPRPA